MQQAAPAAAAAAAPLLPRARLQVSPVSPGGRRVLFFRPRALPAMRLAGLPRPPARRQLLWAALLAAGLGGVLHIASCLTVGGRLRRAPPQAPHRSVWFSNPLVSGVVGPGGPSATSESCNVNLQRSQGLPAGLEPSTNPSSGPPGQHGGGAANNGSNNRILARTSWMCAGLCNAGGQDWPGDG